MHIPQDVGGRCYHLRKFHLVVHEVCKMKSISMLHTSVQAPRVEMRNALYLKLVDKFFAESIKIGMHVPTLGISMSQDESEADTLQDRNKALDLLADCLRDFTLDVVLLFASLI
jgi:hypothetical protein